MVPHSPVLVLPTSEGGTPLGKCGRLQLVLGACARHPGAPLPSGSLGGRPASLDLGMWAGQSGAGGPGWGADKAGPLTAKATQGRGLDSLSMVSIH